MDGWSGLSPPAHQCPSFNLYPQCYPLLSKKPISSSMSNITYPSSYRTHYSWTSPAFPQNFPLHPCFALVSLPARELYLFVSYSCDEIWDWITTKKACFCSSQLWRLKVILIALEGGHFTVDGTSHEEEEADSKLESQRSRLRSGELRSLVKTTLIPSALVSLSTRFNSIFLHYHPRD